MYNSFNILRIQRCIHSACIIKSILRIQRCIHSTCINNSILEFATNHALWTLLLKIILECLKPFVPPTNLLTMIRHPRRPGLSLGFWGVQYMIAPTIQARYINHPTPNLHTQQVRHKLWEPIIVGICIFQTFSRIQLNNFQRLALHMVAMSWIWNSYNKQFFTLFL